MTRVKELWRLLKSRYQAWPRAIQLAVVGLALGLGVLMINAWAVRLYAYRTDTVTEMDVDQDRVSQLRGYLARANDVERERDLLAKRLDGLGSRLVAGNTGTLAAAHLQDHVNTVAADTGVSVQSAQVMREEEVGVYRQVTVRLTLRATIKALADFLEALEYGSMQLSVPYVQIDRRGSESARRRAEVKARFKGQAPTEERVLSATLEIRALAAGETVAPAGDEEGEGAESPEAAES
jgi:hypothetical protein